ncbi:hydrogen gas-evolving membrane-bound hydrogenase subunit E [Aureimonas sp. Leaf427]|uniref:hydrogen gas-evolving membrane-bound hydrogenase subunit E n=2 Tax=unclassified Aureimonas TaxID=2615206 RepID=UPI000B32F44F|nr:hydrogen gas-evolving membrane-bound hydrogenase subunit E [Aureimonas sp. Leaf427]
MALPFLGAILAPFMVRLFGRAAGWPLALLPAGAFVLLFDGAGRAEALLFSAEWVPSLSIRLAFRLDGLSQGFALLVTGIGALLVLYAAGYLGRRPDLGRFLGFVFLFMGAMLGLVLADDLVTLAVFWELTSIASFLLIGFDHEREASRRGAIQALVITGGGGLALLAAAVLLGEGLGLRTLTEVLAAGDTIRDSALYGPLLALVLLAAFTKSAQVPFHVWLPNAMAAPTPVSAYLHSATMVKAGVYLLLRLHPAFGGTPAWETILPLFGGATLLTGAALALRQTDLKLVLAYTTVGSLGLIVLLIGIGTEAAIEAAVLYLLAHALFKGALFTLAGSIDHGAGTRDLRALGGLRRVMPATFAAALLAALSMAGMTPFLGFVAKEEVYAATLPGLAVTLVAVMGNAAMVAAAGLVALRPFLGPRPEALSKAHEGAPLLLAAPVALALCGLLAGVLSGLFHPVFSNAMASAALGRGVAIGASAMPHPGLPLLLSALTIALGAGLYLKADAVRGGLARLLGAIGWGPDLGFDQAMRGLIRASVALTARLQSGRLDRYTAVAFAVFALAMLVPLILGDALPVVPDLAGIGWLSAGPAALILVGIAVVLAARERLVAVVALGIQGLAMALLFASVGAPDLAFTQMMVETLSVVILVFVLLRLDLKPSDRRPPRYRLADGAVALAGGLGLALLILAVSETPFDARLSDFYTAMSAPLAHGRNIVNVVIVDFRGLDTLGEIAVVLAAGLAILGLLGLRAPAETALRKTRPGRGRKTAAAPLKPAGPERSS